MSQIASILQRATRNKLDRLNVITYPTHERYQTSLANTNIDFYLWQGDGIKTWESKYAPLPFNHILLNPKYKENQIPDYITPDIIFSQNKLAHYSISAKLAQQYKIPLVNLEHCLPWSNITKQQFEQLHRMQGNVNVFITDYSRRKWGFDESNSVVIEHGLDTEVFKPKDIDKEYGVLVVCNDYINRSWCCGYNIFQQVTGHPNPIFPYKVLGSTPGLSEAAKDVEDLVLHYNKSKVFLCTATISPISFALLEAMSCGLPVVAMATCAVPEIIKHGYNGMISTNPQDLQNYCKELLMDEDMRKELGKNARKTILERFSLAKFVNKWEHAFRSLI
jgi:glycosyltransferase involved in cell wall biosynthesis